MKFIHSGGRFKGGRRGYIPKLKVTQKRKTLTQPRSLMTDFAAAPVEIDGVKP